MSSRSADPQYAELHRRLRRRGFLGVAAGATAATLLGARPAAAAPQSAEAADHRGCRPIVPRGKLGIQLYTLRDQVQQLGFGPVFRELERYGYDSVEFAGYTQGTDDLTLRQLKHLMREHGLRGIGSHVGYYSADPRPPTPSPPNWRRSSTTRQRSDCPMWARPPVRTATAAPWTAGSAPLRTSTPTGRRHAPAD